MEKLLNDVNAALLNAERNIPNLVPWDVGDSRILLWLSAIAWLFILVNVVGFAARWLTRLIVNAFVGRRD